MLKTKATLTEKKYITPSMIELVFETSEPIEYIPGQFVKVFVRKPFQRPYSVLWQDGKKLALLVELKEPGKGSDFFMKMETGEETEILGSFGKFFVEGNSKEKVFISTGVGVAPFVPMILSALESGKIQAPIHLFQGMSFLRDDIAYHYLKDQVDSREIRYTRCITRDRFLDMPEEKQKEELDFWGFDSGDNAKGRVTDLIGTEFNFNWADTEFYICGGNHMIRDTRELLLSLRAEHIFMENYG